MGRKVFMIISSFACMLFFQNCSKVEFEKMSAAQGKPIGPKLPDDPGPGPQAQGCLVRSASQDGSASLPWLIDSCECLQKIETDPKNSQKSDHFKLITSFSCDQIVGGFKSISSISGELDGNNKTISNLKLSTDSQAFIFHIWGRGVVKNLTLSNLSNDGAMINGRSYSTLARYTALESVVDNVTVTNANVKGNDVGGLVSYHNGLIRNSRITGILQGDFVGGIVKSNMATGKILNTTSDLKIRFSLFAGGAVLGHGGEMRNVNSKTEFTYMRGDMRWMAVGGLFQSNSMSSASGIHVGQVFDSNVAAGSSLTADLSGVQTGRIGDLYAMEAGGLFNVTGSLILNITSTAGLSQDIWINGVRSPLL